LRWVRGVGDLHEEYEHFTKRKGKLKVRGGKVERMEKDIRGAKYNEGKRMVKITPLPGALKM